MTIVAQDRWNQSRQAQCKVGVKIADQNDNAPVLLHQPYVLVMNRIKIGDNLTQKSMKPFKIQAIDLDAGKNGQISYRFGGKMKDIENYLGLDANTGEISLTWTIDDLNLLNRRFDLSIIASDHGNMNFLKISIYVKLFKI